MDAHLLSQYVLSGIVIGVIYSLMALGITFIYSIMKMINWAMGEFYMIGSYVQYALLATILGADRWYLALPLSMASVFLLGLGIQDPLFVDGMRSRFIRRQKARTEHCAVRAKRKRSSEPTAVGESSRRQQREIGADRVTRGRDQDKRSSGSAHMATRFEALEPLRQGIREHLGGYSAGVARGLTLRHDHGSQFMSDHFQDELRFLGIQSSPAFVREPEGNGCVERFIRTLKEQLLWVRSFETVEELRLALLDFKERYNREWLVERHHYSTPRQTRHRLLPCPVVAA